MKEEGRQIRKRLIERGNFKGNKEIDAAVEDYDKGLGAALLKPSGD